MWTTNVLSNKLFVLKISILVICFPIHQFLAQARSFTNLDAQYGITGCGVSFSEIQNKVKFSKGFFERFWSGMITSLQNLGQFLQNDFFKRNFYWNIEVIKSVLSAKKIEPEFFLKSCYLTKYFETIWLKTVPLFHFRRYWSFLWTHSSLG